MKSSARYSTKSQAGSFLKACNDKTHGFIFKFALLSGMRPEEYLAMQWKDLDFERNTAQIRRVLVRHKKTCRFQEPKTKGSKRTVTIPASLSRKLAVHKRTQSEHRLKIGNEWKANDLGNSWRRVRNPTINPKSHVPVLPTDS